MKLKAAPRAGSVVIEVQTREEGLPPIVVSDLRLKKILLPVDFSDCSQKALHYATAFARQFQTDLLMLHVVEAAYPPPELLVVDISALHERVQEEAERQLARWSRGASGVRMHSLIRNGNPEQEIIAVAEEENVDLIILGTHGRMGMAHLFLGGTAEKVMRRAPCPVMVVRVREHDFVETTKQTKTSSKSKGSYGNRTEEKRSRKGEAVLR